MDTPNEKLYYPKNVYYGIFGIPPRTANLSSEAEELLESVLETLLPQESEILMLKYKNDMTLQEIAESYENLNEYEISEITAATLRRLRHPSRSRNLKNAILLCPE